MITKLYGKECPLTGGAFINDCDHDGAGMLLQHIYGALAFPSSDSPAELSSPLIRRLCPW